MFDTQNCLKENDLTKQSLKPFYETFISNDHIEEDDHVIIISVESGISDLNEVLYK